MRLGPSSSSSAFFSLPGGRGGHPERLRGARERRDGAPPPPRLRVSEELLQGGKRDARESEDGGDDFCPHLRQRGAAAEARKEPVGREPGEGEGADDARDLRVVEARDPQREAEDGDVRGGVGGGELVGAACFFFPFFFRGGFEF